MWKVLRHRRRRHGQGVAAVKTTTSNFLVTGLFALFLALVIFHMLWGIHEERVSVSVPRASGQEMWERFRDAHNCQPATVKFGPGAWTCDDGGVYLRPETK